jgi:sugar (pentulose or hexulose) kinase
MANPLILTIDLGTQSVRAMLVDSTGNILHKTQHTYEKPYYSLNPGWAEQKPDIYWNAVCDVTGRLRDEAHELWNDIIAVTLTTIRDTCICMDKSGKPLRDFIVWLDKRQAIMSKPIPAMNNIQSERHSPMMVQNFVIRMVYSTMPINSPFSCLENLAA